MFASVEEKIRGERKPRFTLCGDCGCVVSSTELLCEDCRNEPTPEPVDPERGLQWP